jgi:hypothetical protein
MELEKIILSELNQAQKGKSYRFSLICGSWTTAILWDAGHTENRSHTGDTGQERKLKT